MSILKLNDTQPSNYLDERLRFEELLSQISAKFVNLPPNEVDKEIEFGLRLIVEFLGIDRSSLLEFSEDQSQLIATHSYAVEGTQPVPPFVVSDQQPWLTRRLLRGGDIRFSKIDELPDEAILEKGYVANQQVKSAMIIPLAAGGRILGGVAFVAISKPRTWPEGLQNRLRLLGEIFANALVRKQAEEKLHKAFEEIKYLKERLEAENVFLQKEIELAH